MSVVLAVAVGAGRSSEEPKLRRHQQPQQQQRTWAAHRNPRMGVREAAEVTDMATRRAGRGSDCQPNVRFGPKVSPHPVTVCGERFVHSMPGDVALQAAPKPAWRAHPNRSSSLRGRNVIHTASSAGSEPHHRVTRRLLVRRCPFVLPVACVTIFGDMNTFCIGLVPQSE